LKKEYGQILGIFTPERELCSGKIIFAERAKPPAIENRSVKTLPIFASWREILILTGRSRSRGPPSIRFGAP
jgi:hypothetical protein